MPRSCPLSESPDSNELRPPRNPHSGRGNQFRIGYFRRNFDSLPPLLFLWPGIERHPVLIAQMASHILKVRGKAYRVAGEADGIPFAAGLVGQTREINLSPIVLPVAMAEVPHARVI